jgi:hypothetical protein
MKLKISFLFVAMMIAVVSVYAQSARNPLNLEPANIRLNKGFSPKKLSGMTLYRPDGTPFDRTVLVYGESGRKTSELNQRWNVENDTWTDVSKSDFMYQKSGMLTLVSVWAGDVWSGSSKMETRYDEAGKIDYSFRYNWNKKSGNWSEKAALKEAWNYDENGRATEVVKWSFNKQAEAWNVPATRVLYSYDEQTYLQEEVIQSWNHGAWKNAGKYTYSRNERQNEYIAKSYIASGENWIYDGKIICIYDEDGDMTRCEYYDKNTDESLNVYCVYTYINTEKAKSDRKDEDINVYPNPAVTSFDLIVPEELIGETASLFDISGKSQKSFLIDNARMKIDVSGLPTGVYFMKAGDCTKKIFIK